MTTAESTAVLESLAVAHRSAQTQDIDAIAADYLATAKKQAAQEYWDAHCPPEMRQSDWNHPGLVAHKAQIDRVLTHIPTNKGLLLKGETGCGKTRAMWALMLRLSVYEGREVRCYAAQEWFSNLQSWLNYGRDDAGKWVEACARRKIVFIDDLGQEAMQASRQDWAMGWFFRFLDIRVGEGLPLYITTNLGAEDLASTKDVRGASKVRGDPLVRRLLDVCEPIKF